MPRRKPETTTQQREPEQLRDRVIFARTTAALHEDVKRIAAELNLSVSLLAEEWFSRLVKLHNPNKPRAFVVQTTTTLHDAAKEDAARLNLSLNDFTEDALLAHVNLHNPTQGTASDANEKTSRQETGQETQGEARQETGSR